VEQVDQGGGVLMIPSSGLTMHHFLYGPTRLLFWFHVRPLLGTVAA
jgi:hypothetical protein